MKHAECTPAPQARVPMSAPDSAHTADFGIEEVVP